MFEFQLRVSGSTSKREPGSRRTATWRLTVVLTTSNTDGDSNTTVARLEIKVIFPIAFGMGCVSNFINPSLHFKPIFHLWRELW